MQYFFVLTRVESDIVYRLSLDQALQSKLTDLFNAQHVMFNAKYTVDNEITFSDHWSETLAVEQSFIVDKFGDINGISKSITQPNAYDTLNLNDITKIKAIYTDIEQVNTLQC